MLSALLVDDELNNLDTLEFLLHNDCEGIVVKGRAQTAGDARAWLASNHADVVFLDISMPGETGFQLLDSLGETDLKVVFVSAYNEYALQAIKACAVDYILKPVSITELRKAVDKIRRACANPELANQQQKLVEHLIQTVTKRTAPQKIALPQLGGVSFIDINDMVSLQADSNYTVIHLKDLQKMVISKTLKDFEELLDGDKFVRVHKSYIVNLAYVKEYSTTDGGTVKMMDGGQWSISRRQLDLFLEKMKDASLVFKKS